MKYLSTFLVLSLVLLTGCTKESKGDAVVKHAELTKFEEGLVNINSEHSFILDMEINNEEITEIIGTVDYYENGVFVRQIGNMGSQISQENIEDTIRVAFIQQPINEIEENWLTSVMTDDGQSSVTVLNKIDGKARINFAAGSGGVNEGPLIIGKSKVIGTIAYSSKDEVSIVYEIETKEDLKRATDYEQVYLLSVEVR